MINYSLLGKSTLHYEELGYKRVEVPWTVTKEISDITRPEGAKDFQLVHDNNKVLVASAEQSFLYQYAKGFLPKGRFQAITPCFRFENIDGTHSKTFMKNELINTEHVDDVHLQEMILDAKTFFDHFINIHEPRTQIVQTGDQSFDITFKGIELGSYGIRSCSFLTWIYGTGVAEPRFTTARMQ